MKCLANVFRQRILERRQRLQRLGHDSSQCFRRNVADLRVDRDDRTFVLFVALELFPVRSFDLQIAVIREFRGAENRESIAALDLIGKKRLIEPDELDRACFIFEDRFEDFHALHRRELRMRGDDASPHEHSLVEMVTEVGDVGGMAAIFVAKGKEPEQIVRRC